MARFLEVGLASPESMGTPQVLFTETGRVLKVMSGNTVIKTFTAMNGVCDAPSGHALKDRRQRVVSPEGGSVYGTPWSWNKDRQSTDKNKVLPIHSKSLYLQGNTVIAPDQDTCGHFYPK